MKNVIIIGAGIGGLSTAIRLQSEGFNTIIIEKNPISGGKMGLIEGNGFKFDLGPTIVMMPQVYREVFEVAGKNPDDYIPMEKLDPIYSVYFDEKEKIDVSTDLTNLTSYLESISYNDANGYLRYLSDIYNRYLIAKDNFIEKSFRSPKDFYNPKTLMQALKLKTFNNAYASISKFVKDDRLRKLLSFQTLYIGISPYNGPSIYTIIPMIEMIYGVWFIKGGMYSMAKGMEKLYYELGGKIEFNKSVDEIIIEDGKATGVLVDKEFYKSDYVVCNADFPYAAKNLIKNLKYKGKYTDAKIEKMDYSCSCFLIYLGLNFKCKDINLHNIIFAKDFDNNINEIFDGSLLTDPSIYLYCPSKHDESLAPSGCECLYVLIPVSNLKTAKYNWNEENINKFKKVVFNIIGKVKGLEDFQKGIIFEKIITPNNFKDDLNAYNGATFGLAPSLLQSNYYRPHNKFPYCEGLYFTGSSVHPGAGVPIVLTSAKLAASELIKDSSK